MDHVVSTASARARGGYADLTALPDGSQPGDVLFNGTGTKLAGTRVGTSLIDSFTVGFDGRLTAAPGSPFAAQGLGPFGSQFRPTNPSQLFVSNAHNTQPDSGTVSAFTDSADGTLTPVAGSPFADDQMAPCWVEITHDGQFLFTVNTASGGSISRYSIAPNGALTPLVVNSPVTAGRAARHQPSMRRLVRLGRGCGARSVTLDGATGPGPPRPAGHRPRSSPAMARDSRGAVARSRRTRRTRLPSA